MANDLTSIYSGKDWFSGGVRVNPNFVFLQENIDKYDEFVLQGSSRSGKTYSVVNFIWYYIYNFTKLDIAVIRETTPTLIDTVLRDFIDIGTSMGLYSETFHNKTRNVYTYNGNKVRFFALDDEGKARGCKSGILFLNEANRLDFDLVQQLLLRLEAKVIIDFNPSEVDNWIYDKILIRDTCAFLKTTYKDNIHFLSPKILREMEYMRVHNPSLYRVFGLGERAKPEGQIFDNWGYVKHGEFNWDRADIFSIDFGATIDPTVLIRCNFDGNTVRVKELLYSTNVRAHHILIYLFFNGYNEDRHVLLADGGGMGASVLVDLRNGFNYSISEVEELVAELGFTFISNEQKRRLVEFMRNGTPNVMGAIKAKGSIKGGIEKMKRLNILVYEGSKNAWNEYTRYTWKVAPHTRAITSVPVDRDNHFMDALRYAVIGYGRQHGYNN